MNLRIQQPTATETTTHEFHKTPHNNIVCYCYLFGYLHISISSCLKCFSQVNTVPLSINLLKLRILLTGLRNLTKPCFPPRLVLSIFRAWKLEYPKAFRSPARSATKHRTIFAWHPAELLISYFFPNLLTEREILNFLNFNFNFFFISVSK